MTYRQLVNHAARVLIGAVVAPAVLGLENRYLHRLLLWPRPLQVGASARRSPPFTSAALGGPFARGKARWYFSTRAPFRPHRGRVSNLGA
ncbi:MAG: hypothetical protein QHJ34_14070 [bacterium]|nr:hypothetical protein [candidate division KSB1 bacterium]MDH7561336.1 hypothetical protein [bacterium]